MSLCPSVHICFLMVCCALCQSSYSAEGNTEAGLVSRKPGEIKLPNSNPVEGVDKKKKNKWHSSVFSSCESQEQWILRNRRGREGEEREDEEEEAEEEGEETKRWGRKGRGRSERGGEGREEMCVCGGGSYFLPGLWRNEWIVGPTIGNWSERGKRGR